MKKIRLLVVCPHPENRVPGQRLKYEQYFDYFRDNGIELTVKPFMTNRFQDIVYKKGHFFQKIAWTLYGYWMRFLLLFSLRKYDVSYVFLWVTPFGPPVFEWLFRKLSRKMIYDIDDLVYLAESKSNANKLISGLKGRNKPIFLMRTADHVITCTPYLDEFVRKYNAHTTDISSTINTERYVPRKDYSLGDRKVVLGWSGSYSTSKYLHLLEPVFRRLAGAGIPFKLLVMGDPSFHIDGIEVEALEWKDSYETDVIGRFDIGLYPLPNEQWVYGKSGLKALQYMAMGVPTIATAIGANFRIIENDHNGFLAGNEDDWFSFLKNLIVDEQLRRRIGEAGRQVVHQKFSILANRDTYLSVVKKVAAG
ncbi:MAG: glycosyltransferase [Citrobacter freundii]|nr:MAG: glycosyltransferase [Citrobacter freundii]